MKNNAVYFIARLKGSIDHLLFSGDLTTDDRKLYRLIAKLDVELDDVLESYPIEIINKIQENIQ